MKIEDFVRQNRSAFDDQEPSDKIWKNVEASVGLQRGGWWNSLTLWRAAAVIFMVLSVYLLIPKGGEKPANSDIALKEFTDVEAFYVEQISQKVEMIDEFQRSEGLNGFTQDFQQLEAMYLVLKEEMHTHPSQKVKDALVLNLLVRIDLLNQQLHSLEKGYKAQEKDKKSTSI
ncbi:hypothetical protein [Ohtaekwangia koreensis]|uniref:Anti-sigma factor n=1 Tax=Ohtaekwangia koreensis TaxID=688867 RepID=A0A1T5M4K6_9BACT|nr:hypothetical protein [Ohtaekwangia koreensis]SKC83140.1 hypothetical protein SAMN05660236_4377 [Ohtaekwangia koreensis]